jgi:hypothetical protein
VSFLRAFKIFESHQSFQDFDELFIISEAFKILNFQAFFGAFLKEL